MGIEKVVRDWEGAAHMVQMLPLAAHGRPAPASLSVITGPARDGDDGPEELHVVLLDDGRSTLRGTELESALHCIRCGACLYACPVYRQVGGHAYGATYTGPIGAVLTPRSRTSDETAAASCPWMSSLCGACTEACPVKIPLDEQLVTLRGRGPRARSHHGRGRALRGLGAAVVAAGELPRDRAHRGRRARAAAGRGRRRQRATAGSRAAPFPFSGWTERARRARARAPSPSTRRWRRRVAGGLTLPHARRGRGATTARLHEARAERSTRRAARRRAR